MLCESSRSARAVSSVFIWGGFRFLLTRLKNTSRLAKGTGNYLLRRFLGRSTLAAAALLAGEPAFAQLRQNDVRATASVDLYYAFSPQWTVNLFSEGQLDHDLGRAADFFFRPSLQYHLSPDWTVGAGYV